jgi:hypothetical protein
MALETNLNVSPYFDDSYGTPSDPGSIDKNYHRVLFRPGYAVQARELTQMQTILQNQIERFANRVVHDGKIISGCSPKVSRIGYVKLRDRDAANNRVLLLGDFYESGAVANLSITGETSGVTAQLVDAVEGSEAASPNYLSLFVKYTNSGLDSTSKTFSDNEQLILNYANGSFAVAANTINSGSVGYGLRATTTDGIIYHKGNFVSVDSQGIILEKYDTQTSKKLGFETKESIIDSNADSKLLDNATGSTNYSAPGANRLKLTPTLSYREIDSTDTSTFFSIAYVEEGFIVQETNDDLGGVDVTLAERIGEIHGNFATKPFNVRVREHKKGSNNLGRYEDGNINKLVAEIEPSIGYVGGNRIELLRSVYRDVDKATDFATKEDRVLTQSVGNYIICDEVAGSWDLKNLDQVTLYDTAQGAITDGSYSGHTAQGNAIGAANVRGIEHHTGDAGSADAQYRIYLFNVQMSSGESFSDVRGLYIANSGGSGTHSFADAVLESGSAKLKEAGLNTLVYPFTQRGTKLYQKDTNPADDALTNVQFVYRTEKDLTVTGQTASVTISSGHAGGTDVLNETGSISDTLETEFVVVSTDAAETADKSGTITVSGTSVSGTSTDFVTEYEVGGFIKYYSGASPVEGRIASISDASNMTLETSPGNATGVNHHRVYKKGHIFDFSDSRRNIESTGSDPDNTALIDFGETWANTESFSVKVYANVLRTGAVKASKTVSKNKFVHINTSTHSEGSSGPWSLAVPDAYKLVSVYKGSTTGVSTSDEDVTSHFILDSGQKDAFYGTSMLKLKPSSSLDVSSSGLLVEFNYFVRDTDNGVGFFSADSYPVQDSNPDATDAILSQEIPLFVSPTSGKKYDLRDSIDYRPMVTATATPSATGTAAAAPTNPSVSTTFSIATESFVPAPDENFQTDIEYYLPRKDRIVLTKEGTIEVIKGISSITPKAPDEKAGSMTLATLEIPPYPSLSPYVARNYNRNEYSVKMALENNRRYTMKDLRAVERRVKNLEYYSSLNALETSAKNKQIFGSTGLDRYKNGFLVDNFDGHNIADTTNSGYKAAIDRNRTHLRPTFERNDVPMNFNSLFNGVTTNLVNKNGMLMLEYSNASLINQPFGSKLRNPCQEITFNWHGYVELNPSIDNTPDITTLPDVQIDFDGMYAAIAEIADKAGITGTDWGNWVTTSQSSTTQQTGTWNNGGGGGFTQTTTTQTDQIREGLQTTVSPSSEVMELGNFVENVAVRDYMRSRLVKFSGKGLRPDTNVYPYFEDELVTSYCTPANSSFANTASEGSTLTTDSNGNVYGVFRIPNDENLKFRVGTRRFELKDVANTITQSSLISTQAHGDYTSIPLDITQHGTSVNLVTPQISTEKVSDNRTLTSTRTQNIQTWWQDTGGDGDPLAQTFHISEGDSDGVFLTKLDLWFGKKSSVNPITVQIREVENGTPTTTIVPFGTKTLLPEEVNVYANTASQETSFEFDTPVFLSNNKNYCFVVKPAGNDTDYAVWTAELGGKDAETNQLIYKPPYSGVMMVSSNDKTWESIQSEDIKFKMHKAQFTTSSTGTAYIENEDVDFINFSGATGQFNIGEKVNSSNGSRGFVHFYDAANEKIWLTDLSGTLEANNVLTGSVSGANCMVSSIEDIQTNTIVPKLPTITYSNTSVSWSVRTTSSSGINSSYIDIDTNEENDFTDSEKLVYSYSNETGLTSVEGSTKSLVVKGSISTTDKNISPVIDTNRMNIITLGNIINNATSQVDLEEWKEVGSSDVRYTTKPVELSDGNDAEDLKVFVTAYKPQNTNVYVYARIHNPEDAEGINEKDWTPLTQLTSADMYSDSVDKTDFREFEFGFSANTDGQGFLTTANSHARLNTSDDEIVAYRSGDGSIHSTFKTFAIKIVMTSTGSNIIPLCKDMRAIALQK